MWLRARLEGKGCCWHTVQPHRKKVGHPPSTWSTTADKSFSNCFSSPVRGRQTHSSRLQTIGPFLLPFAPMGEGGVVVGGSGRGGFWERLARREKYICPTELHCRDYANVPCARGLRDWASELNYLITQFTKSPGLSPQEIWEAEYLGR